MNHVIFAKLSRAAARACRAVRPPDVSLVAVAVVAIAACAEAWSGAHAAVEIVPLARYGDSSPDGDGSYGSATAYGPPCINDSSQVVFSAVLWGNAGGTAADEVLVRVEADATGTPLAREGSPVPGGTGFYDNLKTPNRRYVLNNDGRTAFVCEMTGTPGGSADNQAIFSTEGPGTETLHVRIGDLAPGTGSAFVGLFPPTINNMSPVRIAFYAYVGVFGSHPGHLYSNLAGTSTLLAKVTDPVPGDGGSLFQFDESQPPSIEPYGDTVAFRAQLTGTPYGSEDDAAIYKTRGSGLAEVVRGRQPVPGGGANLDELYDPVLNAFGNVAFRAVLRPTSLGEAVLIEGGDLSPDLVAITGEALPDTVSKFSGFYSPALSAGNVAAFRALLRDTPGGGSDDEGIFRGDGTTLIQVAREGQVVPEGDGQFATFGSTVAINTQAQVLFSATLRGTDAAHNAGLYLWDEIGGIQKVIRKGDTVPGSGGIVTGIGALSANDTGGFRSLNDASEAVAILDIAGTFAKPGIYRFRVSQATDVADAKKSVPVLRISPNPWMRGPLHVELSGDRGNRSSSWIDLLDVTGRRVRRLELSGGQVEWEGRDDRGNLVPDGVYFARASVAAGPSSTTRFVRMIR